MKESRKLKMGDAQEGSGKRRKLEAGGKRNRIKQKEAWFRAREEDVSKDRRETVGC